MLLLEVLTSCNLVNQSLLISCALASDGLKMSLEVVIELSDLILFNHCILQNVRNTGQGSFKLILLGYCFL